MCLDQLVTVRFALVVNYSILTESTSQGCWIKQIRYFLIFLCLFHPQNVLSIVQNPRFNRVLLRVVIVQNVNDVVWNISNVSIFFLKFHLYQNTTIVLLYRLKLTLLKSVIPGTAGTVGIARENLIDDAKFDFTFSCIWLPASLQLSCRIVSNSRSPICSSKMCLIWKCHCCNYKS